MERVAGSAAGAEGAGWLHLLVVRAGPRELDPGMDRLRRRTAFGSGPGGFDEHFARQVQRIDRHRESGIHGHLQDHFDDFLRAAADIERSDDVDPQRWLGIAEGGQRGNGGQLPGAAVEPGRAMTSP